MGTPVDTSTFEGIDASDLPQDDDDDENGPSWDAGLPADAKKTYLNHMNQFDEKLPHQVASTIRKPRRRAYTLSDRGDDEEEKDSDEDSDED